jgi:hypothetical protein
MSYRGIAWRLSFHERANFAAAPVIMAVAAAASAVISAAGAVQQGKAARKAADYQAALAENSALAAGQQADMEERQQREKALRLLSNQRARAAKGGVLADQGSPLFTNLDTGEQAEIEALNIRRSGAIRSDGYRSQAALGRFRGEVDQQAGYLKATTSLLDGVSRVASAYR